LRSWNPRPPSPRVEGRLFGGVPKPGWRQPGFRLAWLAPSVAAFILVALLTLDRTPEGLSGGAGSLPFVAVVSSNLSFPSNIIAVPISGLRPGVTQAISVAPGALEVRPAGLAPRYP
jgi:hypothetical protein